MLDYVEQQFANRLEQHGRHVLGYRVHVDANIQVHGQAVFLFHPARQPLQGRHQAAFQYRRAEFRGQRSRRLQGIHDDLVQNGEFPADLPVPGRFQPADSESRRGEKLLQTVVEHLGHALPFVLLSHGEFSGQPGQLSGTGLQFGGSLANPLFKLIARLAQFFFGPFAVGNIAAGHNRTNDHPILVANRPEAVAADPGLAGVLPAQGIFGAAGGLAS